MKKRCLLIGGAGFIGINLAKRLVKSEYKVTVYDMVGNPFEQDEGSLVTYIKGDYFGKELDDSLFKGQDLIVLLACSVGPKSSMENSGLCYEQDITKMVELLEKMRKNSVTRLVFISSGGTVYGNGSTDSFSEDMTTYPINHYGIMKLAQEKILIMYNQLYNMHNIVFRLANPYGPGQKMSSGVGAITSFMNQIIKDEVIYVYGKGEVIRDYIYIDDVVEMAVQLLNKEDELDKVPIYNVGTGYGTSLLEIIKIIEDVVGKKAKIQFLEERDIDVSKNVLRMDKMFKVIGEYHCLSVYEGILKYYKLIH